MKCVWTWSQDRQDKIWGTNVNIYSRRLIQLSNEKRRFVALNQLCDTKVTNPKYTCNIALGMLK